VFEIRRPLVICIAAISASVACTAANREAPSNAAAHTPPRTASAVSHKPWRVVHKGSADLSTGVYIREDDDLVVNTPMPIVLRRTYNSGDAHSRQFGLDATHPGEWWIHGDGNPRVPWGDLILADGGRIHFVRISPGDTQEGAVLRHDSTPTEFNGALLAWTGSRWTMQLRDGSTALFRDCPWRGACSLLERRDPDGHRIEYVRDSSGTLLRMESEGQNISFDYDDHDRIVRAYDTTHREVVYTYDERGRLVRASGSDGVVRRYEYDDRGRLIGVRAPHWILQNRFDDAGRWVGQTLRDSEQDPDPYVARARYVLYRGSIVEAEFDEGGGVEVLRYNAHHYVVSDTFDADGPAPIAFEYTRDAVSNVSTGVQLSCVGPSGRMTHMVDLGSAPDTRPKQASLIRQYCLPPK